MSNIQHSVSVTVLPSRNSRQSESALATVTRQILASRASNTPAITPNAAVAASIAASLSAARSRNKSNASQVVRPRTSSVAAVSQFASVSASAAAAPQLPATHASVRPRTGSVSKAASAYLASAASSTPLATSASFAAASVQPATSLSPLAVFSQQLASRLATSASQRSRLSRSRTVSSFGSRAQIGSSALVYNSAIEQALVNAQQPLAIPAKYEVHVGPFKGLHLNKDEETSFRGPLSLSRYAINTDPNPEVLRKRLAAIKYTQEIAIRHLNPPTPPKPGDLIIKEFQKQIPAAPPVIIRQEGNPAPTPAPLVIRQAPPTPPPQIPEQVVEVEGKPIPPPARRVIFERFPDAPPKPQNILIEKWLPYQPQRRRVVFQPSCAPAPPNPRNLIIEWQQPAVEVEKVCQDLGVCNADPEAYKKKFGNALKQAHEIPNLCCDDKCPCTAPPATPNVVQLEGDVEALKRVDLEAVGLAEYKKFVQQQ